CGTVYVNAGFRAAINGHEVEEVESVHFDVNGLQVDWLILASQLVCRSASDLLGGHGGRHLREFAAITCQCGVDLFVTEGNLSNLAGRRTFGVVTVGRKTKTNDAFIYFFVASVELGQARGAADH